MKNLLPLLIISLFLFSCNSNSKKDVTGEDSGPLTFKLTELWATDTVMITPESVLFDSENGLLYVANMNRSEDIEGNGFISKLNKDGSMIDIHWVSGLNDPKGMGIFENKLFVTDVTALVIIDIEKAHILETIPVDSANFLNDLAIDKDGKVYFSDSGTGKIHIYSDGIVSEWITEGLDRPNGLYIEEDHVLLSSSGSGDVKAIDKETGKVKVCAEGIGRGDGLEYSGNEGYYLVSDWSGEVFIFSKDTVQSLLSTKEDKKNTADIGFNIEEQIVYVPTFFDNRVVAYQLEEE